MKKHESQVKALQRELLTWVEGHSYFCTLTPEAFNEIRFVVIRGTFDAYRAGIVGLDKVESGTLWDIFIGNILSSPVPEGGHKDEITDRYFRATLMAYAIGGDARRDR